MKSMKKLFLACALSLCVSSLASAQLPPEVKADLLQEQIVDSLKAKDYRTVKDKIFEYKNLGVVVPPAILLINAKIAIQEQDFQEGQSSLEEYFNAGGKEHKSYQEALSLYKSVRPKAQAEKDRLAAIARDQQSRRDSEAKRLADIEADKQAILDRGKKIFVDAFSELEVLVEGYEPSRKDEKTYLRVSQSLYGADVMDCDFKYSRNVSKNSKGSGKIPSEKSGSNIYASSLLDRAIQSKRFNYTNSYVVKSSLPDGRGNWVDTSYRQTDKVSIEPTMLGELMLSSPYQASTAKKHLERMQEGCDIVSGEISEKLQQAKISSQSYLSSKPERTTTDFTGPYQCFKLKNRCLVNTAADVNQVTFRNDCPHNVLITQLYAVDLVLPYQHLTDRVEMLKEGETKQFFRENKSDSFAYEYRYNLAGTNRNGGSDLVKRGVCQTIIERSERGYSANSNEVTRKIDVN